MAGVGENGRSEHGGTFDPSPADEVWIAVIRSIGPRLFCWVRTADIYRRTDTELLVSPIDCRIAKPVADLCRRLRANADWRNTRRKITENYGYDRYLGNCRVIPSHALKIMAMLCASENFQRAQTIANAPGRDTGCNACNVGCLLGLMCGPDRLDAGTDWRGPTADGAVTADMVQNSSMGCDDRIPTPYLPALTRARAEDRSA